MRNLVWLHTLTLVFVAASFVPSIAQGAEDEKPAEISLTDKEIARLDIFEERALFKAEADFDREDYAAARVKFKGVPEKSIQSRERPRMCCCEQLVARSSMGSVATRLDCICQLPSIIRAP